MVFPLLRTVEDDPIEPTARAGKVPLALGPIKQLLIVLLSLPVAVPVSKNTVPPNTVGATVVTPCAIVAAPKTVQLVIKLLLASARKRIVPVPDVAKAAVLLMVSEFPPVFRPFMVTLSAPLRSISALPLTIPLKTLDTPPDGCIKIEVCKADPLPLALSVAALLSAMLALMLIVIEPW